MAIAYVQSRSTVAGASPRSLAFSSAVTPGSLLVAAVFWNSATETCTFSDSVNGAWTSSGGPQVGLESLLAWRIQMFYFPNTAAGTPNCTATTSGGSNVLFAIHEYSGIATTSPVDTATVYNQYQNDTTWTTDPITNVTADALLFCANQLAPAAPAAPVAFTSPFTGRELGVSFDGNGTGDQIVSSVAARTCTMSALPNGGDNTWFLAAFKAATVSTTASVAWLTA